MRRAAAIAAGILLWAGPAAAQTTATPLAVPSPRPHVETLVKGLAFPTNMAFAPDGRLFYDEKNTGRIRIIDHGRLLPQPFAALSVFGGAERGLLGLALDPNFGSDPWVYVYYTSSADQRNHVARIRANGNRAAGPPQNLLTLLPASSGYHNGGDITFGPDGKLYVVVGDAHQSSLAQDPKALNGKILRLNPDGSVPSTNPFGSTNPVYAYGIRNSFGLCVDPVTGDLWETENGPSSDDEVNRIVRGGNYGWPKHLGPTTAKGFVSPVVAFQKEIVPTGCTFWDRAFTSKDIPRPPGGQLLVGDFHADVVRIVLQPKAFRDVETADTPVHLSAGITDVEVGPDGALYVATANAILRVVGRTGHGTPSPIPTRATPTPPGNHSPTAAWILAALLGVGVLGVALQVTSRLRRRSARAARHRRR